MTGEKTDENEYVVNVAVNGRPHTIVVGRSHGGTVLAFEPLPDEPLPSTLLRFRCEICGIAAKFAFVPPSSAWRRPFVVRRVTHNDG